jgi:isopentenyl diphosphate isomerase/L-lactate dehydrogenase-like FMN-dependent dehydrogenase
VNKSIDIAAAPPAIASAAITRTALNIDDLRTLARRRLPRGLFEYVERGAEDDVSLRANRAAFGRWQLLPQIGIDVSQVDLSCRWFGRIRPLPIAVGPTALSALLWYRGEEVLANAALRAGVPYTTGTHSLTAMETLFEQLGDDLWFQLYMLRSRAGTWDIVERARRLGIKTLMVTLDIPVEPNREYSRRSGFSMPFRFTPSSVADVLSHPRWLTDVYLRYRRQGGLPKFGNLPQALVGDVGNEATARNLTIDPTAGWDALRELRERWPHTLVIKGVLHAADAVHAAEIGCDGIVISNHGGRGLDGAIAPLSVLPEIRAAVGDRLTVLVDSGFRRGTDVIKALALGADGVLLGRATLYGLAAAGEAGASRALGIFREEMARTLALLGCPRLSDLSADQLRAVNCG